MSESELHAQDTRVETTNAILRLLQGSREAFALGEQPRTLFESILTEVLGLTGSEYGFISEVLRTGEGAPYLKTHATTGSQGDAATGGEHDENAPSGLESFDLDAGEAIIANAPAEDFSPAGIPGGHPPLDAFLGLPLLSRGRMVGMVGVANRPGGYAPEVAETIEPFLDVCAVMIDSFQSDRQCRRAEAKQVATAVELERIQRELREFNGLASHDLQEPLRKIVAFSDLLRMDLGDDLPQAAAEDLSYIIGAARRMQDLVRDLMALNLAGRVNLPVTAVSLGECVDRALEKLSVAIAAAEAVIDRVELPVVRGVENLLTQLFQNLLHNGIKFHGDGPPAVQVTCEKVGGETVYGVRDNGIGIREEYCEQIFAPFKRLHGGDAFKGTGIGLAICRRVVERHGGRLWVESEPGVGSHFRFTLGDGLYGGDASDAKPS